MLGQTHFVTSVKEGLIVLGVLQFADQVKYFTIPCQVRTGSTPIFLALAGPPKYLPKFEDFRYKTLEWGRRP